MQLGWIFSQRVIQCVLTTNTFGQTWMLHNVDVGGFFPHKQFGKFFCKIWLATDFFIMCNWWISYGKHFVLQTCSQRRVRDSYTRHRYAHSLNFINKEKNPLKTEQVSKYSYLDSGFALCSEFDTAEKFSAKDRRDFIQTDLLFLSCVCLHIYLYIYIV